MSMKYLDIILKVVALKIKILLKLDPERMVITYKFQTGRPIHST